MNLGFEYILRHNLAKSFLKFPCSIFLHKQQAGKRCERMTVFIDQIDDRYIVKQWMLTECEKTQALPPMNEFYIQSLEKELDRVIPNGFSPIDYIPGAIVDRQNTWRKPMDKGLYNTFSNEMFNSPWHIAWKSLWLWETFSWIYLNGDKETGAFGKTIFIDHSQLQRRCYPILCKYMMRDLRQLSNVSLKIYEQWNMWNNQIFSQFACHGELAFANPQRYFKEANGLRFPSLKRFRMPRFKANIAPENAIPDPPLQMPTPAPMVTPDLIMEEKKKMLLEVMKKTKATKEAKTKEPLQENSAEKEQDLFAKLLYGIYGNLPDDGLGI